MDDWAALLGLLLDYFLPRIAYWATHQPWKWEGWWVVLILAIAGVVAGILLASAALEDTLKVSVTDTEVQFQKNKRTRRVPREQIRVAFLDGNDIVLQAADSRELARERHDQLKSEANRISAAFEAHGYPWSAAGDPYRDDFRRWVEDDPELPPAVNAVLRARSKANASGHKGKAVAHELRDEAAKLGYAIRDVNADQYWRSTTRPH